MASDVYTAVGDCGESAVERAGLKKKRNLKLLPPSDPVEFLAMDILALLPKATTGNQVMDVITDWYTK